MDYIFNEDQIRIFSYVEELKNGNMENYSEFYRLTKSGIEEIVRAIVKVDNGIEYVVGETYKYINANFSLLESKENFYIWAYKIATDKALSYTHQFPDFYRLDIEELKKTFEVGEEYKFECISDDEEEFISETILKDVEKLRVIQNKLNNLNAFEKVILQCYYLENESISDIANKLDCDRDIVKITVGKIRKLLKKETSYEKNINGKMYSLAAIPFGWIVFESAIKGAVPVSIKGAAAGVVAAESIGKSVGAKLGAKAGTKAAAKTGSGVFAKVFGTFAGKIAVATTAAAVGGAVAVGVILNQPKEQPKRLEDKEIIYLYRSYNVYDKYFIGEGGDYNGLIDNYYDDDRYFNTTAMNYLEAYQGLHDDPIRPSTIEQVNHHDLYHYTPVQYSDDLYELNKKMSPLGNELFLKNKDAACARYYEYVNNMSEEDLDEKRDFVMECHDCISHPKLYYYTEDCTDRFIEQNGKTIEFKAMNVEYGFEIESVKLGVYVTPEDMSNYMDEVINKEYHCVPIAYMFIIEGHYTKGQNEKTAMEEFFPEDTKENQKLLKQAYEAYLDNDEKKSMQLCRQAADNGSVNGLFFFSIWVFEAYESDNAVDYVDELIAANDPRIDFVLYHYYNYKVENSPEIINKYNLDKDVGFYLYTMDSCERNNFHPGNMMYGITFAAHGDNTEKGYRMLNEAHEKGFGIYKAYVRELEDGLYMKYRVY